MSSFNAIFYLYVMTNTGTHQTLHKKPSSFWGTLSLKLCLTQLYLKLIFYNLLHYRNWGDWENSWRIWWAFVILVSYRGIINLVWTRLLLSSSPTPSYSQAHTLMCFTLSLSLNLPLCFAIMSPHSYMTFYGGDWERDSMSKRKSERSAVTTLYYFEGTSQNCSIPSHLSKSAQSSCKMQMVNWR